MKQKIFTKKFKLLLVMAFAMLVGQNAMGVQLVSYPLTSNYTGSPSGTFSTTATPTGTPFLGSKLNTNGWNTAGHYHSFTAISTIGYHTVVVNAKMSSLSGAPTDFMLEYNTGSGWTSAGITGTGAETGAITVTTSHVNYPRTLPVECSNKASVQIRWIQTNLASDGAKISYISGATVSATPVVVPLAQSTDIGFVSITPTTITVSISPGDGDNRIILVNTSNNFPVSMANDYNPPATPTYPYGDQGTWKVIYNGSGSSVLVTVPTSTQQLWFRSYDYISNGGVTRYVIDDDPTLVYKNPNLCALATITANTATNIKLISATLGATISSSPLPIFDRGIVWNTTGEVQPTDNSQIEFSSASGSYSFNYPDVPLSHPNMPRGTRIYYKGFVTNESGTIYSNELSFTNYPVFTGTGTWETAARWNVNEVPGLTGPANYGSNGSVDDSPTINGTCTLGATNSVTNLTINNSLAINTTKTMTVNGTLTNNNGNSGILIKSAAGVANGSLIWPDGNAPVSGTVQMYSKAYQDANYHWQYFGIPVENYTLGTLGANVRIRKYHEENADGTGGTTNVGLWRPSGAHASMGSGDGLVAVDGYEVTQPSPTTYSFSGTLNHTDVNRTLAYSPAADWTGQNILANPFTGAVEISNLTFGTQTESNVYLYNAGSLAEWSGNNGASVDGTSPGQYTVSNGLSAGTLGSPHQIPSMQGFLVKAMSSSPNATFGMPLSSIISNGSAQRAKAVSNKIGTRIDVVGAKYSDKMWIFTEESATRGFDNGFDGPKMIGSALTPQLYAMEADGIYQINAVKDINNTQLGFKAGSETNLKLVFTHQNIESTYGKVYLVDLVANKTVDVTASGTEYEFTSEATPTAVSRFKIVTQTTGVRNATESQLRLVSSQNNITISNPTNEAGNLVIYNLAGSAIQTIKFDANGLVTIPMSLGKGIYVAKATTATEEVKEKLIIR